MIDLSQEDFPKLSITNYSFFDVNGNKIESGENVLFENKIKIYKKKKLKVYKKKKLKIKNNERRASKRKKE